MHPCDACGRHLKATSLSGLKRCPFCDRVTSKLGTVATVAATVVVGLALSACYGGPAPGYPPPPPTDPSPSAAPPTTPGSPIAPDPK